LKAQVIEMCPSASSSRVREKNAPRSPTSHRPFDFIGKFSEKRLREYLELSYVSPTFAYFLSKISRFVANRSVPCCKSFSLNRKNSVFPHSTRQYTGLTENVNSTSTAHLNRAHSVTSAACRWLHRSCTPCAAAA
jgi:hypothetical protein